MKRKVKRKLVLVRETLRETKGGIAHRTTLRCHESLWTVCTVCESCDPNYCYTGDSWCFSCPGDSCDNGC